MRAPYESSITTPKLEGFEWQEPDGEEDLASFRHIVKDGCTLISVYPDEAGSGPPFDFIYSVGFYLNLQHPEIFMKGVLSGKAGEMINSIFRHVEAGNTIKDGDTVRYDLGDGDKKFVARAFPIDRYFDYLGWGCWFYRSLLWKKPPVAEHKFPVLQLFWADSSGRYPWDADCDKRVRDIQTPIPLG
jgi:hypothetical protein